MKKVIIVLLIVLVVIVALGGVAMIIRNSVTPTPPNDDTTTDTPVDEKEPLTVAGKSYTAGSEISFPAGTVSFGYDCDEEYNVTVAWDSSNKKSEASLSFGYENRHYGFAEAEFMKTVKIEKTDSGFNVVIPAIDDYFISTYGKKPESINYAEFSALKFNMSITGADKTLKFVLIVDLTKGIPTSVTLDKEELFI